MSTQSENPFADYAKDNLDQSTEEYELSENVIEDVVHYSRGCIIGNEQQAIVTLLGWLSGWMADESHYTNNVVIGTSSSGKTHLVRNMKALIPRCEYFQTTSASQKGLIDEEEWNEKRVAIMSEWQKLPNEAKEFMKSVAGDDGGYDYSRGKGGSDDANVEGSAGTNKISQKAMPYSFTYAQFSMDNEMWTRLLKTYVDESKYVNVATAKKHHDHEHIQIAEELDEEYIKDVSAARHALRKHINSLPSEFRAVFPEWMYYAMAPTYDLNTSESKRFTASISNLIRSSCLINYKNRETTTITREGETYTAHIIEPQDVVNIGMACRDVLLGTTHGLEPRKFKIIEAIAFKSQLGAQAICTIDEIQEYLRSDQSDMSQIGKGYITELLGELEEEFIVTVHENYQDRKDGYELLSLQNIGYPKLVGFDDREYTSQDPFMGADVDPHAPFTECVDPIRQQSVDVTVSESREKLSKLVDSVVDKPLSASDAMGSGSDDEPTTHTRTRTTETPQDGQQTFGSSTTTIDDPVTATVYEHVRATVDGEIWPIEKTTHEFLTGVVPTDSTLAMTDVSETIFDPEHVLWDQPDKPDSWVITQGNADGEIELAVDELLSNNVFEFETDNDDSSLANGEVRITVNEVDIDV